MGQISKMTQKMNSLTQNTYYNIDHTWFSAYYFFFYDFKKISVFSTAAILDFIVRYFRSGYKSANKQKSTPYVNTFPKMYVSTYGGGGGGVTVAPSL